VHRWFTENVDIDEMVNSTQFVEHAFDVFYKYAHVDNGNQIRANYKMHRTPDIKCYYQSMNQTLDSIETVTSAMADKLFRLNAGHPFINDAGVKFGYYSPLNNIQIFKQDETSVNDRSTELSNMAGFPSNPVNDNVKFIVKLDKSGFNVGGLFAESSELPPKRN